MKEIFSQIAIKKLFSNETTTIENKKTSYQLIFVNIFRKKYFKDNLENFMSESLNATSTPVITVKRVIMLPHVFMTIMYFQHIK